MSSQPHEGSAHVLVVDDDPGTRGLLCRYLSAEGFVTHEADDGLQALRILTSTKPDIVLLDVALPGMDGLEVLQRVRDLLPVPVIIVTGAREEQDRVRGLDLGADDYVVKPFSLAEVRARIQAVLRRAGSRRGPARPELVELDELVVDVPGRRVWVGGEEVRFTAREFDLLAFFATHPGRVFSREDLLHRVWGSHESWQGLATVTEHVRRVRRKLGDDARSPRWIVSVRGAGYRFGDDGPPRGGRRARPGRS